MDQVNGTLDPRDYKYRVTLISNERHTIDPFYTNYSYGEIFKVAYEDAKNQEFMLFIIEAANDPTFYPIFAVAPMDTSCAAIYDPNPACSDYVPDWGGIEPINNTVHHVEVLRDCMDDQIYLMMQRDWIALKEECRKASYGFVRIADLYELFKRIINSARRAVGAINHG